MNSDRIISEIIGKIHAIDKRMNGLIQYTEYLATGLDSVIDYTEHCSKAKHDGRKDRCLTFIQFTRRQNRTHK